MEKLTNLEFYKKNQELFLEGFKRKINISVMDRITIYNFYKNELKKESKMQSLQNTCEEFFISDKTVYNCINMLERKD